MPIKNIFSNAQNLIHIGFWGILYCFSTAWSATDPDISWRQLNTPHFTVIYDARQKKQAENYAQYCEEAHAIVSKYYPETPPWTAVLIWDQSDFPNAFAMRFPYPNIMFHPTLPSPHFTAAHYGNWARETILHEFTHILSFEPANGFWRPFRWVFGSAVVPTALLPDWYLEGLAVDMETREGQGGRLRSPYFHATLRAIALEGQFANEGIDRANERNIPTWPGGDRPYLFGSFLVQEMNRLYGSIDIQSQLIQSYSRRVPFFLATPVEERLNKNYEQLFASMVTQAEHNAAVDAEKVRAAGLSTTVPVESRSYEARSPIISPDGTKLAFISKLPETDGQIFILSRNSEGVFALTENDKPIVDTRRNWRIFPDRISWSPDGQKLVYSAVTFYDRFYLYSDLYVYDLKTSSVKQLTRGLRAQEPTFSLNGQKIVFRHNLVGKSELAEVDKNGENFKVLYNSEFDTSRVSWPEFLSENEIAFTERLNARNQLKILDLSTMAVSQKLDSFDVQYLRKTPKGLMFTSESSGIMNVYLADAKITSARPLTNVITRAATPEFDAQSGDVYFAHLHGDGIKLERIKAADYESRREVAQVTLADQYKWTATPPPQIARDSWEENSYSAGRYMWPRYWYPWLMLSDGRSVISASTGAVDPLQRHQWNARLIYDSAAGRPGWAADYRNAQTRLPTAISVTDQHSYLPAASTVIHSSQGEVKFDPSPLLRLIPQWSWTAGWEYYRSAVDDFINQKPSLTVFKRTGPNTALIYSNVYKQGFQVSPERGITAAVSLQHYINQPSFQSYEKAFASITGYMGSFWRDRHAFMIRGTAITHPRLPSIYLGSINSGADFGASAIATQIVTRGYSGGTFLSQEAVATTLEYRFPLWEIQSGGGTQPFFTRRLHGAAVSDLFTLRGKGYDTKAKRYEDISFGNNIFVGGGGELKLDMTVFYNFPITLVGGVYTGSQSSYQVTPINFNLGMGYQGTF